MNLDNTVDVLSEKYGKRYSEVYLLVDRIRGRLLIKHPIHYLSNYSEMLTTTGLIADKYLGIQRVREQKYYKNNVVI